MFEVRNLAFDYGSKPILRDVSFVVSPGEVVSIVGANGSGKTTLLRALATLAVPDGGLVLADGVNAFERPLRYRRLIGYLPENPALDDDLTAKDYLVYRANLKGEPAKRVRRRVSEAVEMCCISSILREPIGRLSLGLRRRVALADAILLRPRILLLDDFLAGLDYDFRQTAGTILSEAAAFSSVIVTGHEVESFVHWTTRFLILRNGVISMTLSTAGAEEPELCEKVAKALAGEGR